MARRDWLFHPFVVAVAITALNAVKPVCVDDTAYLIYARHISTHFDRPYQFSINWNDKLEPAMDVLCPPMLPYYLAAGRWCLLPSEHALKIWLLPISLLLTYSLRSLARAWQLDPRLVPLCACSGFILPLYGFMLDVPAISLGVAAMACVVRGGVPFAALGGVLITLAFETKYTMLTLPFIVAGYCVLHRRWLELLASVAIAGTLIHLWEYFIFSTHGSSHFLHHLKQQTKTSLLEAIDQKSSLLIAFVRHGGLLLIGPTLIACQALFHRRWLTVAVAVTAVVTFLGVTFLPAPWGMRFARIGFHALGFFLLVTMLASVLRLVSQGSAFDWFLIGWLGIELVAYLALSPFPAGRRVIGVGMAFAFISLRIDSISTCGRVAGTCGLTRLWLIGPLLGFGLFALDAWDARVEKVVAEQAVEYLKDEKRAYYFGHWGFQYYCEWGWHQWFGNEYNTRPAGLRVDLQDFPFRTYELLSRLRSFRRSPPSIQNFVGKDGYLVIPELPNSPGMHRPLPKGLPISIDRHEFERIEQFTCDDWIPGSTIPSLYGESFPIKTRDAPRLTVGIYRVKKRVEVQTPP